MNRSEHRLSITSNIEDGKRNLDQYGYTVHPAFVTPEQLAEIRARLTEQAELELEQNVATYSSTGHAGADRTIGGKDLKAPPNYQQISALPNKGQVFIDLFMHPIALDYAKYVFRDVPFNLATQSGGVLRKGGKQQVVHVDQQAWPFPTPIPVMLNMVLCISDFDADMGATLILPGSHRSDPPSIGGEFLKADDAGMIPLTAKAGTALFWESRTWHCQGTHVSDKDRYSIATVYSLHCAKPQDFYPAVIHDDIYERLSDDEKRMLGFEVVFEYAGRIGPRHPADARNNLNARLPYIPELRRDGHKRAVPKPAA